MWNFREIIMPTVVSYDVVTIRSLSTLVLQHILEVLHGLDEESEEA